MSLTFSCLFLIEMIMKLYAMGVREYFRDKMNSFDCFIILVSLSEQVMDILDVNVSGNSFKVVTAFRTLRIFRVFKLARAWSSFRDILIAIISTFDSIALKVSLWLQQPLLDKKIWFWWVRTLQEHLYVCVL